MQVSTLKTVALATLIGLGVSLSACKPKEESTADKVTESVKDGLDMRENEGLKDAGEDLKDAAKDTGEAVKDKAEDLKDDAQK